MGDQESMHLSDIQTRMVRVEERANNHEDVIKEVRADLRSIAEILVQVQLGFATMQEKQSKDSFFIKSFMGVFLSVTTAVIIYGIRALI